MANSASFAVGRRRLSPTPVFDTLWKFAATRQAVYLARLRDLSPPWTGDEIIASYRFTNVFRASDRVSQYLIRQVVGRPEVTRPPYEIVFRTLLFKIFNRESTWEYLENRVGPLSWETYDFARYRNALDDAAASGPIYSAAYLMPPPPMGETRKHANHLRLLEVMMRGGLAERLASAESLRELYVALICYPTIGPFLAFQYSIDLNYSTAWGFDENEFVVPGPGARDGLRKCFGHDSTGIESEIIRHLVETQEEHFDRLGLSFPGLFGRRLHLIDVQNLLCEIDKYARLRHPEVRGISGRSRIKQRFRGGRSVTPPVFPARWGLDIAVHRALRAWQNDRPQTNGGEAATPHRSC